MTALNEDHKLCRPGSRFNIIGKNQAVLCHLSTPKRRCTISKSHNGQGMQCYGKKINLVMTKLVLKTTIKRLYILINNKLYRKKQSENS